MNNILGLDVGKKRIGLSIGHEETKTCNPLKSIDFKNSIFELEKIISKEKISLIVIGLPLDENNNETTISSEIRNFAKEIEDKTKLKIVFVDEYMSSSEAMERLNIKSKDKKTREKGIVDVISATIILERYFANEGIIIE